MKWEQLTYTPEAQWTHVSKQSPAFAEKANLVLCFGDVALLEKPEIAAQLKEFYPNALLAGCSGGGEIINNELYDECVVAAAINFERTTLKSAVSKCGAGISIESVTKDIGTKLAAPDLRAILLFCDGMHVDGHQLVRCLNHSLGGKTPILGGAASNGLLHPRTLVGINSAPEPDVIGCIGLYGDNLLIHWGTFDGCRPFGLEWTVTRSEYNVVYEFNKEPAYDVFMRYLGEQAKRFPATALQFPMRIRPAISEEHSYNRTIVSLDPEARSVIFAGTVPAGTRAQLMRASLERLVEAAELAALKSLETAVYDQQYLALLISCFGRKLAYGDRIHAELAAVSEVLGANTSSIGFYSNGEFAPHPKTGISELLNHTMTIVLISEK